METLLKLKDTLLYGAAVVFFTIIAFFAKETYTQISTMNVSLNEIKLDIARLQSTQIDEKRVEEIAERVFYKIQAK